jgi:hypothetical protein
LEEEMRFLLFVLLTIVLLSTPATLVRAQNAPEVANVNPAVGNPGTRYSFIASGFQSRERVGVWLNRPDGRIITIGIEDPGRATREGRATWGWEAPRDALLGTYSMVAKGANSGIEYVIRFEIRSPTAIPASSNIEPKQANPGRLVVFYASGFRLDEDVRVWANSPDGKVVVVELESKQLADGRVDASWTVPRTAIAGTWQLVVHGVDSGFEQVLSFVVRS